jgi:hypothetical protein
MPVEGLFYAYAAAERVATTHVIFFFFPLVASPPEATRGFCLSTPRQVTPRSRRGHTHSPNGL